MVAVCVTVPLLVTVCVPDVSVVTTAPSIKYLVLAKLGSGAERLALWQSNTKEIRHPEQTLDLRVGRSYRELAKLIQENQTFDFIYVDGNHSAASVLADASMCFGLLRPTGIMLFDDYLWDHDPDWLLRPKMSVDAFVNMYQPLSRQIISNYQLAIQRIK